VAVLFQKIFVGDSPPVPFGIEDGRWLKGRPDRPDGGFVCPAIRIRV
jgi:hypothetical protein